MVFLSNLSAADWAVVISSCSHEIRDPCELRFKMRSSAKSEGVGVVRCECEVLVD